MLKFSLTESNLFSFFRVQKTCVGFLVEVQVEAQKTNKVMIKEESSVGLLNPFIHIAHFYTILSSWTNSKFSFNNLHIIFEG